MATVKKQIQKLGYEVTVNPDKTVTGMKGISVITAPSVTALLKCIQKELEKRKK